MSNPLFAPPLDTINTNSYHIKLQQTDLSEIDSNSRKGQRMEIHFGGGPEREPEAGFSARGRSVYCH